MMHPPPRRQGERRAWWTFGSRASGAPGSSPGGAKLTEIGGRKACRPVRSAASSSAFVFGVEAYGSRSDGYGAEPCIASTASYHGSRSSYDTGQRSRSSSANVAGSLRSATFAYIREPPPRPLETIAPRPGKLHASHSPCSPSAGRQNAPSRTWRGVRGNEPGG